MLQRGELDPQLVEFNGGSIFCHRWLVWGGPDQLYSRLAKFLKLLDHIHGGCIVFHDCIPVLAQLRRQAVAVLGNEKNRAERKSKIFGEK